MFEDQHVELLPARTTMQTINIGGFAAALSLAANVVFANQQATAISGFGDAAAVNSVVTGNATAGDAAAEGGAGGDGGNGGAGITG